MLDTKFIGGEIGKASGKQFVFLMVAILVITGLIFGYAEKKLGKYKFDRSRKGKKGIMESITETGTPTKEEPVVVSETVVNPQNGLMARGYRRIA